MCVGREDEQAEPAETGAGPPAELTEGSAQQAARGTRALRLIPGRKPALRRFDAERRAAVRARLRILPGRAGDTPEEDERRSSAAADATERPKRSHKR
jgi:hypothetical protein